MTARAGIRVLLIASMTLAAGRTFARADEPQAAGEPHYADVTETEVVPTGVLPPQLPHELEEKLAGRTLAVGYEIYVAPDGHVIKIDPLTSVPELDEAVRKGLLTWLKPAPPQRYVRFSVHFTYRLPPPGYRPPPPRLMPIVLISGNRPSLPDDVKKRNIGKQLVGVYIVSVDRDGHVTAVEPKVSIPGADAAIVAAMKSWRYKPIPMPLRRAERLVYDIVPGR